MEKKTCTKCNAEKPLTKSFFYKNRYGFDNSCKECRKEQHKEYQKKKKKNRTEEQKIKQREYQKEYRKNNLVKLKKMTEEQKIKQREYQKEYQKKKKKNRTEEQKIKQREYQKEYRKNNPTKTIQTMTEEQKIKRREYDRKYTRKRRQDPLYRLRNNIRTLMWLALKRHGGNKGGVSLFDKVPYTQDELKEHLETQFDDKMSWDNYGTYWHVDHIYPQSLLPFDSFDHPNFLKCWRLENLQPLERIENIRKSNSIHHGVM